MKNKILFHSNLYDLKMYPGERRWRIVPTDYIMFSKLLASDSEITCNFDEKKDHRSDSSKTKNHLAFDFESIFKQNTPKSSFVFNQEQVSDSYWHISYGQWGRTESPAANLNNDTTFTFNGKIHDISLSQSNFKNLVFNQKGEPRKDYYGGTNSFSVFCSAPQVESLALNNFKKIDLDIASMSNLKKIEISPSEEINIKLSAPILKELTTSSTKITKIETINCPNLEKVQIGNCEYCAFRRMEIEAPKLKEVDLTKCKWISLFDSIYEFYDNFEFLKLDFSPNGYSWDEKTDNKNYFKIFQKNYESIKNKFNFNCKIKLNPESYISSVAFPSHSSKSNDVLKQKHYESDDIVAKTYKVKEIFEPNTKGEYIVTLWDFIQIAYKKQKETVLEQIKNLDMVLNNIPKFEKKWEEKQAAFKQGSTEYNKWAKQNKDFTEKTR